MAFVLAFIGTVCKIVRQAETECRVKTKRNKPRLAVTVDADVHAWIATVDLSAWTPAQVEYHRYLVIDAKLAEGPIVRASGDGHILQAAILRPLARAEGRVCPACKALRTMRAAACKAAGVAWSQDIMRHTYATMRLASEPAGMVALDMGTSEAMLLVCRNQNVHHSIH